MSKSHIFSDKNRFYKDAGTIFLQFFQKSVDISKPIVYT